MVDSSIKTVPYRTIIQNEREMSIVKCTTVPPGVFRPKAWKSPGGQERGKNTVAVNFMIC